jgi:Subtilase family/Secretion system C-terminal sorting domain
MKNRLLLVLLLAQSFLFAQNKWYYIQIPNEKYVPKINIVNGKKTASHIDANITKALSKYNIYTFEKAFPTSVTPFLQTVYILEVDKTGIIEDFKNYSSFFPKIEETYRPELLYIPNDYSYPSGSSNPSKSLELINIKEAWDYTHGDPNFKIGISDTPIRMTHEDLIGKVTSLTTYTTPDSHGTAVASHAAANTDNAKGIPGTGFNSTVLFKSIYDGAMMNTLLALSQNGARVVNASWYNSCSYSSIDQLVIDEIHNNGTVIIVAAGNGATCGGPNNYVYPASYNHVISISTVGHFDVGYICCNNIPYAWQDRIEQIIGDPTSVHQHNDMVDLRAPGFNVLGAVADSDSSYGGAWGTSLAAPQVTGVVALLFSVNSCLHPNEVETILKLTSANLDNIPENQPFLGKLGAGRIDAGKATKMAWQMNPANGGEISINGRNFSRWDFELMNSPESINILNQSFTQNANVSFKAKKSILLNENTVLEPGPDKSHYLYIDDNNTCYSFNASSGKLIDTAKNKSNYSILTEFTAEDISIYPIPAKNNLFIKTKKEINNSTVKIFDTSNRLVFEKNITIISNTTIDISNLLKGVYFIDITDSSSRSHYYKKFIKQ